MSDEFLSGEQLDQEVLKVVQERQPIKVQAILESLGETRNVYPHEMTRSVWRLVEAGHVSIRPGLEISLRERAVGAA